MERCKYCNGTGKSSYLTNDGEKLVSVPCVCIECNGKGWDENTVYVYGDYTNFGSIAAALEELKIEVKKSALERVPTSPIEVTDEQMADIEKIIEKIEDDDDVQAVFTNLA
jgi:transcriptional/translational regulatory protein YebC/TACO1